MWTRIILKARCGIHRLHSHTQKGNMIITMAERCVKYKYICLALAFSISKFSHYVFKYYTAFLAFAWEQFESFQWAREWIERYFIEAHTLLHSRSNVNGDGTWAKREQKNEINEMKSEWMPLHSRERDIESGKMKWWAQNCANGMCDQILFC